MGFIEENFSHMEKTIFVVGKITSMSHLGKGEIHNEEATHGLLMAL